MSDVMDDPIESGLSIGMIALSAYRAMWHASATKPPMLEDQDDCIKQEWLEMICNLDNGLASLEGQPVQKIVIDLAPPGLRPLGTVPLEVAIRHAWMLLSTETNYADSPEALAAEELLWAEWAANRRSSS